MISTHNAIDIDIRGYRSPIAMASTSPLLFAYRSSRNGVLFRSSKQALVAMILNHNHAPLDGWQHRPFQSS